jgi:hypothetical protein
MSGAFATDGQLDRHGQVTLAREPEHRPLPKKRIRLSARANPQMELGSRTRGAHVSRMDEHDAARSRGRHCFVGQRPALMDKHGATARAICSTISISLQSDTMNHEGAALPLAHRTS